MTGTDTGVGKTTVAVALARLAFRRGRAPIPFKPVETGCDPDPDDARRLWEAARPPTTLRETCPFPFELAAAPAAAAAAAGQRLELGQLVTRAEAVAARGDFLIVEGAGGLLVPYQDSWTNADIALRLRLPVLVVGRMALGTINHVALTLAEIGRRALGLAGVILVRTSEPLGAHESSNARLIEAITGTRPLGTLPFLSRDARAEPDQVADALAAALPAEALAHLIG
ncbi:MAG TPA: dethiobiotin synthase [Polyangia bacterium]